jgi:hypothetical protein
MRLRFLHFEFDFPVFTIVFNGITLLNFDIRNRNKSNLVVPHQFLDWRYFAVTIPFFLEMQCSN